MSRPPDSGSEISILDARLAEIDRRLQSVQTGLVTEERPGSRPPRVAVPGERSRSTAPPPATAAPARSEADALLARLRQMTADQEGVLAAMRELLGAMQRLALVAPGAAGGTPGAESGSTVALSAGPFSSTDALRAFRATLEALPGVRAVQLRGFEGTDRALLDVQL